MKLVGMKLTVSIGTSIFNESKLLIKEVDISETENHYTINDIRLDVFNFRKAIPKDMIGIVQKEFKYLNIIDTRLWILKDTDYNESYLVSILKDAVSVELSKRQKRILDAVAMLNKLK